MGSKMVGSGVRSGVESVSTTGSGGADSSIGSWAGTGTDLDDLLSLVAYKVLERLNCR